MPPHTKSPAVHRHKTAPARSGLAVGVLAAAAAGTVAVGAGPRRSRPAVLSRPPSAGVRGWRNRASGCGERFTEEERTS